MTRQGINTGISPNDGLGDTLLTGAIKINSNFTEIYNTFGDGTSLISYASTAGGLIGTPNINAGIITATSFVGSGASLTGLTGASANTYGNPTAVPQIVIDSNGRITSITNVAISGAGGGGGGGGPSGVNVNDGNFVGFAGTIDFGTGISVTQLSSGIVTANVNYSPISGYSTSSGVSTVSGYATISGYSTSSGVSTVSGYATISGYSTASGFSTASTTASYATISGYSTASGFSTAATSSGYATISGYSTASGVSTVSGYATISGYSTSSGVSTSSGYATISGYSTSSGLSTFSGYATISGYSTSSGVSTSVIGGIGSLSQLNVSGVSTFLGAAKFGGATGSGSIDVTDNIGSRTYITPATISFNNTGNIQQIGTQQYFRAGTSGASSYYFSNYYGGADHELFFIDTNGNVRIAGILTATQFVGDGSQLTGIGGTWGINNVGIFTTKNVGIGTTAKSDLVLDVKGSETTRVSISATSVIGYGSNNSIRLSSFGFLFPDFYTSVGNDLGLEVPLGVGDFEVRSVLAKFRQTLQVGTIGVGQSACVFIDARGYMGQGGGQGGPWIGVGAGVSINGSAGGNIQIGVTTGATGVNIRGNNGSINATGIITAAFFSGPGAMQSRTTVNGITTAITNNGIGNTNITGFKSYALMKVGLSTAGWLRLYTDSTSRTADASRSIGIDPSPGSGVIAEVITTGISTTQIITPFVMGGNFNNPVDATIYAAITNLSGVTTSISVNLTILQLEV